MTSERVQYLDSKHGIHDSWTIQVQRYHVEGAKGDHNFLLLLTSAI